MDEANIRMLANLMALVADMEKEKAFLAAMQAANKEKELSGDPLVYPEYLFCESAKKFGYLASRMREEI